MSEWKETALKIFAKRREYIEELLEEDRPGALWFGIWLEFEKAYEDPFDEEFIEQAYEYAFWCLDDAHTEDVVSAVIISFYELLPTNQSVRTDLHNHLTKEDFLGLKELFRYCLTKQEYEIFVREFLEKVRVFDEGASI